MHMFSGTTSRRTARRRRDLGAGSRDELRWPDVLFDAGRDQLAYKATTSARTRDHDIKRKKGSSR